MSEGLGRVAIARLARRPRPWIWLLLAVAFGLGLGQVPLFGTLGYELALAAAGFAAICGLDLGCALGREIHQAPAPAIARASFAGRTLASSTLMASALAVTVAIAPAIVCAVRGVWTPTCDWWFGIWAYVAMPLATAALAGALGHAIGVAIPSRPATPERLRPHLATIVAQLPIVVLAVTGVWRFYASPPVFVYNAIIGYFPGNLYDENVQLGMPLLWARLEQLLAVVAIVAAIAARLDVGTFRVVWRAPRPAGRRLGAFALALACAAGAITLHVFGGALGYAVDPDDIEHALGGRIETAHFVISYADTPELAKEIALIAADHELRYAQVVAQLGVAPAGKLHSFYFASSDQKARWMGARDVEMAKPWRGEIYLDHRAFPHGSLRHEIAHAVAAEFGDPIFGVAARRVYGVPIMISPGLVEGLAVAIDWPGAYDRLTPHEAVRALQTMGIAPTIAELLSIRFLTVSSARSYTTAGSFLKFLLDSYGAAKLRAVYASGGDFDTAYGKPVGELEAEWRAMIATITLPADVVEGSRERFRAGSVFSRPCPHAIADRRQRAAAAYGAGDRPAAVALMREVCGDAPEEPRHRLELADYLVTGSPIERAEALALWSQLANDPTATSSLRADALERLARIAALQGELAPTIAFIDRAHALPVEPNARRQLDAEAFALHHAGPAGPALRGYFFPSSGPLDPGAGSGSAASAPRADAKAWAAAAIAAEPELGLGYYLLGLQQFNAGEWADATASLERGLARGLPNVLFVRNGARRLAIAAFRTHDAIGVAHAIALLHGPEMARTDHLLAEDWSQRLVFDATGHL